MSTMLRPPESHEASMGTLQKQNLGFRKENPYSPFPLTKKYGVKARLSGTRPRIIIK
jgi:hypothetical protein